MRIDVHAHYYPDDYLACLGGFGRETSNASRTPGSGVALDERLALLDRFGVEVQVVSVGAQQPYFDNLSQATAAARLANDLYAQLCHERGGRFAAFAALPLPHVDASLHELERALDTLGMLGVNLGCSVAGRPLDEAAFEPLWAELDRRQSVVFLHPQGAGCGPFVQDYNLTFTVGAPFEDTIAALRLILSGITTRYPRIRFIVPHLGGAAPFLVWRFDGSQSRSPYKPSEHLKRMWFDTCNEHEAALLCARATFGAPRLLLGTDFPHLAGARFERSFTYIEHADLPAEEKAAILDHNAQTLLGIPDRVPRPSPSPSARS